MKAKFIFFLYSFLFVPAVFFSQSDIKYYFDWAGKSTNQNQAYYYRQQAEGDKYKAFYASNNALYYEARIIKTNELDDTKSTFTDVYTSYYKNGKKKSLRTFNSEGKEHGTSLYYYESG